jgi:hypothetical protein
MSQSVFSKDSEFKTNQNTMDNTIKVKAGAIKAINESKAFVLLAFNHEGQAIFVGEGDIEKLVFSFLVATLESHVEEIREFSKSALIKYTRSL